MGEEGHVALDRQFVAALPEGVTAQALGAAVRASTSWRGVLRALSLPENGSARRLRAACDQAGVDYGHFRPRSAPDALVRQVLESASTWSEAAERLGYEGHSGSVRATLRKRASRLGVDVGHFVSPPSPAADDPFSGAVPDLRNLRSAASMYVAADLTLCGFRVSWPLEPALYDLVVAVADRLLRVQVKSSTYLLDGQLTAKISRSEGARGERAFYSSDDVDCFAVVDPDLRVFCIPVRLVEGQGHVVLRHYERFLLPGPRRRP